jgi:carboxyl-terminal processing protease
MLPASNRSSGINIGFPDVCLTPAGPAVVPIPYPNLGMHAMAAPFAATVVVTGMNALNQGSMIPMTTGDEGGVAHPTIKGPGMFTMGNPVVSVEGLPAINLLCPTTGNNMNDGLGAVLVPDAVNVFYTYAPGAAPPLDRAMSLDDLAQHLAPLDAPPVQGAMRGDGIALVAIRVFSSGVAARVYDLLRRLAADGMSALILDLRGNPGGEVDAFLELAGDFVDHGTVLAVMTDGDGDETVHRARGEALYRLPLAILVDRRTASAAELFAGCLKAHGRAVVVGETTYGKGSAQALLPGEGAAVYATVARVALPDGAPVQGIGVRPDVEATGEAAIVAAIEGVWGGGAAHRGLTPTAA